MTGWLQEHGDDMIPVRLADLLSLIARLEQVQDERGFKVGSVTEERIYTCDLPRLRGALPAEALEVLSAVIVTAPRYSPPHLHR